MITALIFTVTLACCVALLVLQHATVVRQQREIEALTLYRAHSDAKFTQSLANFDALAQVNGRLIARARGEYVPEVRRELMH